MSAAVLAIDLARHPSGTAVADVVDHALALSPADLGALPEPAPAPVRERVLAACAVEPRLSTVMEGVTATLAEGLPDARTSAVLLAALTETSLGGLGDLLRMLEAELPAVPGRQVVLDAVAAAWAGRQAALPDCAALRAPWAAGVPAVPPALPETPWAAALRVLLDDAARRTPVQWRASVAAHGRYRGTLSWSTTMHQGCWAAFEAGRLVEVARAQLAAARVLRLSGASTGPDAHAVGMVLTAAVQATCVADVAEPDVPAVLLSPWEAGS